MCRVSHASEATVQLPNAADRIGAGEYEEDTWQRIQIGDLEFKYGKPCSRCIMTTVDPFTGKPTVHSSG